MNELLQTVAKQSEQLERQRQEQTGMTQQILELQHQVTLLRQSSTSPAPDQNATVIDMSPIMKEVQSLRKEMSLMRQNSHVTYPATIPMTPNASIPAFPIARPSSPAASACAGFIGTPVPQVGEARSRSLVYFHTNHA